METARKFFVVPRIDLLIKGIDSPNQSLRCLVKEPLFSLEGSGAVLIDLCNPNPSAVLPVPRVP